MLTLLRLLIPFTSPNFNPLSRKEFFSPNSKFLKESSLEENHSIQTISRVFQLFLEQLLQHPPNHNWVPQTSPLSVIIPLDPFPFLSLRFKIETQSWSDNRPDRIANNHPFVTTGCQTSVEIALRLVVFYRPRCSFSFPRQSRAI